MNIDGLISCELFNNFPIYPYPLNFEKARFRSQFTHIVPLLYYLINVLTGKTIEQMVFQ